jgi:hypothetical protein
VTVRLQTVDPANAQPADRSMIASTMNTLNTTISGTRYEAVIPARPKKHDALGPGIVAISNIPRLVVGSFHRCSAYSPTPSIAAVMLVNSPNWKNGLAAIWPQKLTTRATEHPTISNPPTNSPQRMLLSRRNAENTSESGLRGGRGGFGGLTRPLSAGEIAETGNARAAPSAGSAGAAASGSGETRGSIRRTGIGSAGTRSGHSRFWTTASADITRP